MTIAPHDIHLWFAFDEQIHDAHLVAHYHQWLTDDERVQQRQFYFEKHRHQYLITRALVRSVLSHYVPEISPAAWRFAKNAYGKPTVSNPSLTIPLQFNLSHTDQLVVLAVTLGQEVGVDVEYGLRSGETVEIAEHFFSPKEVMHLQALPIDQQRNCFFDLWTLKEAYIKACGRGLSIPLDHFSYMFPQPGTITIDFVPERQDHPDYWQFWQVVPNALHKVALAIKGNTINAPYSLSMRKTIPLQETLAVEYPIIRKTAPVSR